MLTPNEESLYDDYGDNEVDDTPPPRKTSLARRAVGDPAVSSLLRVLKEEACASAAPTKQGFRPRGNAPLPELAPTATSSCLRIRMESRVDAYNTALMTLRLFTRKHCYIHPMFSGGQGGRVSSETTWKSSKSNRPRCVRVTANAGRRRARHGPSKARTRCCHPSRPSYRFTALSYPLGPDSDEGETSAPSETVDSNADHCWLGKPTSPRMPTLSALLLKDCLTSVVRISANKSSFLNSCPSYCCRSFCFTLTCAMCDGATHCTGPGEPRSTTTRTTTTRKSSMPTATARDAPRAKGGGNANN